MRYKTIRLSSSFIPVILAVAPATTPRHAQCSLQLFLHPRHFLYPLLTRMSHVKALVSRSKTFLCALQVSCTERRFPAQVMLQCISRIYFSYFHHTDIKLSILSFFLQIQVLKMVCFMNLRNMEKLHLFKSTAPQKSATGSSFFASKRTKKKHLEHQRESFFLACKLMSQLGMARVSSNIRLYYRKDNCRQSNMV